MQSKWLGWPPKIKGFARGAERGRIDAIVGGAAEEAVGGDLREAIARLNGARGEGAITDGVALFGKALACECAGDPGKALRYVKKSDHAGRNYGPPYSFRADLLYRLRRRNELREWCEMWTEMGWERQHLFLNQARLMHLSGKHAGARDHVDAILILEDSLAGAYELDGDMLAGAGDRRGALARYTKSLDVDQTVPYVHVKRARLLMEMDRPDLAAKACRRGLRARPRDGELRRMLAEAGGAP